MEFQEFFSLIPYIDTLKYNQIESTLTKIRETYQKLDDQNLSFALFKLSQHIMKLKNINPQIHDFLQQCIKDIIILSVSRNFSVGTEALRNIFNTQAQYYKHSKLDAELRFPLGYRYPLKNYQPNVGEDCDIVKPYISSTSYCGWTRATIISKDNKRYVVKYANSQISSQTKQQPFCAPLGTRTQDFDWRMNLTLGDQVDAFHKVWFPGTVIARQVQNGIKRVRVTFKVFSQNGQHQDKNGRKYDGLNDEEDEWFQVLSYRVQKRGKMSKKLCLYSLNAEEYLVDDTYDLIFQKQYEQYKFSSIMRTSHSKSQSFLQFYQTFCDVGGNQAFLRLLENYNKQNLDPVFNVMIIVANSSFLVPRMKIYDFLPQMLTKGVKLLFENSKNMNPQRNQMTYFFIDTVGKRVMSLTEKHQIVNQIRKRLTLDFLKMNMQKQMIALRMLYELINPVPRKYNQVDKKQIDEYLKKNNLYYQLIQQNTHQQILLRSVQFIKYLLKNELIEFKEIQHLWNIYPPTDLRGKSTVQKMIAQVSKQFSLQYTNIFIEKLLKLKESQLTVDNLGLLRALKDHKLLQDKQRLKILHYLWQIITLRSMNLTSAIEEEVQKVFKSIIPTIQSKQAKHQLLKQLILRLNDIKQLNNQFDILKQFILTYPKKPSSSNIFKIQEDQTIQQKKNNVPQTVFEVVQYLKNHQIYPTIINIFNQLKSPQKIKNVLQFTAFLFQQDKDNVNDIAKIFYEKIGPTDIFFQWAQNITQKAHSFFIQLFNDFSVMSKFQNLSNSGFEALKIIIYDVNIQEGNLKLIKKSKGIAIQSGNNDKQKQKSSTGQGPIYGPVQKPQTVTFLYLLKSPYECQGVKFLQELLCIVKSSKVYDEIIKLIIQFFVNLDQSILDRTKQFRQQFLMDIIQHLKQINSKNDYNEQIKLKIQISINLLQQLFAETQKQGLFSIKPHFECIQGQTYNLKIQNHITANKLEDTKIEINQNSTLWTLKVKLAQVFQQKPHQLDIYKFTTPISDQLNAKSLNDLHFYNDQNVKVMKKGAKQIPRKQLLNQTGQQLSPKFKHIINTWFNNYKNEANHMGIQQLKNLSQQCWKGSLLKQMSKLNQMLSKFDKGQKGYLTLDQFENFFIAKSAQNPSAIWRIINLSGYKNNLKYKDQEEDAINPQIYPRRILSNEKVYNVIFDILQNKTFQTVHLNIYRLLALLQTDKSLKEQVKRNAKSLIQDQTSLYKLSYILETVLSEITINTNFFVDFYKNKGCEFIFHKLSSFMEENKSVYSFDPLLKTIVMPNMIKILNSYIFCLQSGSKFLRYLRKIKINTTQIDHLANQLKGIKVLNVLISDHNELQEKLNAIKNSQFAIQTTDYHKLAKNIFFNLIENFNSDFLTKISNEVIRMYCCVSIQLNQIDKQSIIKGLKSQSLNFRRACQNLIFIYLSNNNSQIEVKNMLQLLLTNIPEQSKVIYSYFFVLLQKVLQMYLDLKKIQQDDLEFIQLADKLFNRLFNQTPNQNRNSVTSDKLLLGFLVVIKILVAKRQGVRIAFKNKKKQLLEKCLFFYNPRDRIQNVQITPQMLKNEKQANHFTDYVKCKSQDTRKILMQIIYHLQTVSAQEDPKFIDQYILPIFNDLPKQKRKFETKALKVGLSNLGSTCYLNSMLQILNSVGPFRNGLMQSNCQFPLLKQLKNMFSYLYFSQRQDFVPEQLLKSFVPPILKGIQQDTTQFLNILFDQLQRCLKGTSQANILEQIFQGTQAVQMICHSCGQKRERKQNFFTYPVQIEGKYDLNSALQGMHTGQLIGDCLCQYCGQRSDTTKRSVINTIPNLLFVHLRRIVFNYDVFMNTKIHTRLEFPSQLNFEPYTKEGLQLRQKLGLQYLKNLKQNQDQKKKFQQLTLHQKDKDYYKLKLKGVIVHSGGPEVGHYWAIVKNENGWIKYDDSRVSVFSHSSMESECFGGNFQNDEWGGMGSSTNAYVLLYQKQLKTDVVLGQDQNKKVVAWDKFETYNTAQSYKQVWLDNHSLMLQNHLLRDSYCKQFIFFLVQMLKITPSDSKIQVISQTLYKVCYQSGETGKLMESFLENVHQISPQIFKNYILADKHRTFELLFHNNANVREFTAIFIEKVLLQTYTNGNQQDKFEVKKFIDQYLLLLHSQVAKNWLRIDGYFRLFEGLVLNSLEIDELHSFFVQKHLIAYFIDFIMEKSSPLNIYPKKHSIGTKSNPAHFGNAINLIFFLFKRSFGLTGQNYQIPKIQNQNLYHLSDNDVLCLSSIGFYEKMMKERQNLQILGLLIQRLSIKNLLFSQAVARIMLISLNEITDAKDQMIDICDCISKYLVITDEFWINRAEFILGYSSPYIFNDNLLTSLEDQRFVFSSTLEELFPVQCLLAYCHINRLRNPLSVLHILRAIVQGCSVSDVSKSYLLSQKSPNYHYQRYLDWVKPYINSVIQTLNLSKDKKQKVLKQIQICNSYILTIEEAKTPIDSIITGKILNNNVVDRFTNQDNSVQVVISNVQCYTLRSEPTGFGNASLDQFLDHGRFNKKVTKESNILCLFKEYSKPLAIKQAVEEAQQKQIQSLFDDCIDPKSQNKDIQNSTSKHQQQKIIQQPLQIIVPENINQNTQQHKIVEQQKQEIQKQQDIVYQINVPQIQLTSDYFRKIQIINNSSKNKRVILQFKTNENSNMLLPSKIYFLSTKKAIETMWICKVDSTKGWGIVDYQLTVDEKQPKSVPKWFKLYGQQDKQCNIDSSKEPMQIEFQEQNIGKQWQQQHNVPIQQQVPTEINCPICTFFNLSTATQCEACGSSLNG